MDANCCQRSKMMGHCSVNRKLEQYTPFNGVLVQQCVTALKMLYGEPSRSQNVAFILQPVLRVTAVIATSALSIHYIGLMSAKVGLTKLGSAFIGHAAQALVFTALTASLTYSNLLGWMVSHILNEIDKFLQHRSGHFVSKQTLAGDIMTGHSGAAVEAYIRPYMFQCLRSIFASMATKTLLTQVIGDEFSSKINSISDFAGNATQQAMLNGGWSIVLQGIAFGVGMMVIAHELPKAIQTITYQTKGRRMEDTLCHGLAVSYGEIKSEVCNDIYIQFPVVVPTKIRNPCSSSSSGSGDSTENNYGENYPCIDGIQEIPTNRTETRNFPVCISLPVNGKDHEGTGTRACLFNSKGLDATWKDHKNRKKVFVMMQQRLGMD